MDRPIEVVLAENERLRERVSELENRLATLESGAREATLGTGFVPSTAGEHPADRRFKVLVEKGGELIVLADAAGRILEISPNVERILGYRSEDLRGCEPGEPVHPDDRASARAALADCLSKTGDEIPLRLRVRAADGSWRDMEGAARCLLDDPDVGAIVLNLRDATDRNQAEARYRTFLEQSAEGIWRIECDEPIPVALPEDLFIDEIFRRAYLAECNDTVARMYGFAAADEIVGGRLIDFLPPSDPENIEYLRAFIRHEFRLTDAESHELDRDGRPKFFLNNLIGTVEDGRLVRAWGTQRDITDRKRVEDALRESEERFRGLADNLPDGAVFLGVARTDRPIELLYVSAGIERILGVSSKELPEDGRFLDGFRTEDDRESLRDVFETSRRDLKVVDVTVRPKHRDDGSRRVHVRSAPRPMPDAAIGWVGVLLDVTERHRLEEQLRQSQRLEAIGRLAGGVAHDFNNLLTIINGYAALLHDALDGEGPARGMVDEILRAGSRAVDLTRQLLAFGRRQLLQPQALSLNDRIVDVARMARRIVGEDIRLVLDLEAALWPVRADPVQVDQVLVNLLMNARDAMPVGGTLSIATRNVDAGADAETIDAADAVELTVTDTGTGMDETTVSRIFEPFFTTKGVGKGTGLGLATVYGIVNQSGGRIDVRSELGAGTTFRVVLPRFSTGLVVGGS